MKSSSDPLINRLARGAHRLDDVLGPIDMKRFGPPSAHLRAATHINPVLLAGPIVSANNVSSHINASQRTFAPVRGLPGKRWTLRSVWAGAGAAVASCLVVLGSFGFRPVSNAVAANRMPAPGFVGERIDVVTPPMTTAVGRVLPRPSPPTETFAVRVAVAPQTVTGSTAQQLSVAKRLSTA